MTSPTLSLPDAPAVIDIEASGFGRGSYPIEVGFVLPDGRAHCMLIRPDVTWNHWDAAAERLHHISRSVLRARGRPVGEVVDQLNAALEGRIVYSDGWGNDYSWLATLYEAADRTPTFRLESLMTLLDERQLARWDATKARVFDEAALARHRASADARLLQETLLRLRQDDTETT